MSKVGKREIMMPEGFLAGGMHCGAKRKRKDLAIIYSETKCVPAAVFTRNTVKAAPVLRGIEQVKKNSFLRAVVVNSGNANCMTGKRGLEDAEKMARTASLALGIEPREVFVSSTGIIGKYMEMAPISRGIKKLAKDLSRKGLRDAADGIMTTDSFKKISSRRFRLGKEYVTITGIAKGAGMIKPEMATTLAYIMTDVSIKKSALKKALSGSVKSTFNSITVDGDMSTNDTVLVMANGACAGETVTEGSPLLDKFTIKLREVMLELASMIVRDGEGAGKFIEVRVTGALNDAEASKAAGVVADSLLVKCAVSGGDPNWGRVASSAGSSGVFFDPGKMTIKLDGVTFFRKGKPVPSAKRTGTSVFKGKDVLIEVDLSSGKGKASFYSCDITTKYIDFNSFYTT